MRPFTSPEDLRRVVQSIRAAHARNSREWTRRMERPSDRGPQRPL
jgi:hypothetical protein